MTLKKTVELKLIVQFVSFIRNPQKIPQTTRNGLNMHSGSRNTCTCSDYDTCCTIISDII